VSVAITTQPGGVRLLTPTISGSVPPGSTYTLRWVSNADGVTGCTSIGAAYKWTSSCENNRGFQIWPGSSVSGFPSPTTFQLEPYSLNGDYFVVAYNAGGKKTLTTYTVAKVGHGLAITIEAPNGSKWASNWFALP
jgi:hypothetical protein